MQNPHRLQHQALLASIENSVERICAAVSAITDELEAVRTQNDEIRLAATIWTGYMEKLSLSLGKDRPAITH